MLTSKKSICVCLISSLILIFFIKLYLDLDDIPQTSYVQKKIIDSEVNLYLKSKMWGLNGDHYWIALSLTDGKEIDSLDFVLYGQESIYYDVFCDSVHHLFLYKYQSGNIDTTFYIDNIQVVLKDTNNVERFKRFSVYDLN